MPFKIPVLWFSRLMIPYDIDSYNLLIGSNVHSKFTDLKSRLLIIKVQGFADPNKCLFKTNFSHRIPLGQERESNRIPFPRGERGHERIR